MSGWFPSSDHDKSDDNPSLRTRHMSNECRTRHILLPTIQIDRNCVCISIKTFQTLAFFGSKKMSPRNPWKIWSSGHRKIRTTAVFVREQQNRKVIWGNGGTKAEDGTVDPVKSLGAPAEPETFNISTLLSLSSTTPILPFSSQTRRASILEYSNLRGLRRNDGDHPFPVVFFPAHEKNDFPEFQR